MDQELPGNVVVHRIGGGAIENLRLRATEKHLVPPGISVLVEGSPQEAAEQMRKAFPDSQKYSIFMSGRNLLALPPLTIFAGQVLMLSLIPAKFSPTMRALFIPREKRVFLTKTWANFPEFFKTPQHPEKNHENNHET